MANFSKSKELLERVMRVTPVGAQTYSKSHRYLSGMSTPYFIDHGQDGKVWDVDGNEFIDFMLALGPITIGYNNPEVNEAVKAQLSKGIVFSQSAQMELLLAEKLTEVVPCAEMVRFVKNGGDATTGAVRLARAATGRDMVAVCGYHGMHDWYVGSTALNEGVPTSTQSLTKTFEYNKIETLASLFDEFPEKLAAVILEPAQENGPENNFLQKVKALCEKNGTVLIFDEVVSGFRIALGGAQEYYDVTPDLSAIGKGMGNGMPISAVVGKKELLKQIDDGVFISTTFGGEALSLAGALKTIEILEREDSFPYIWEISTRLLEESVKLAESKGLESVVSMWGLAPHSGFIFNETGALSPVDLLSVYQQRLLNEGVISVGINNFCLTHTIEDIDKHIAAIDLALDDVKKAIEADSIENIVSGKGINPIFKRN